MRKKKQKKKLDCEICRRNVRKTAAKTYLWPFVPKGNDICKWKEIQQNDGGFYNFDYFQ